jgi:hypothetical protein
VNRRQAAGRLRDLLRQANVNITRPSAADVRRTWAVMQQFAKEPFSDTDPPENDGDGIRAEYRIWDVGTGDAHFQLAMTRHLKFTEPNGEFTVHLVGCSFSFIANDELRSYCSAELHSSGMTHDSFFAQALAMPGFAAVTRDPLGLQITDHRF